MKRLVCSVALSLALVGCSASAQEPVISAAPTPTGTYAGLELDPAQPRPTFTLIDTTGKAYDFAKQTRGRPTLLFFGYTHCPDVCPTTMADVGAALAAVPAAVRDQVSVVFVTTDPKRDTGPVMARWLRNFDPELSTKFVGLTGSLAQVEAAQVAAKVPVAEDNGQTHSAELMFFGKDDYARVAYVSGSSSGDLQHDLPLVVGR